VRAAAPPRKQLGGRQLAMKDLPKGWHTAKDTDGQTYYYNRKTKESTYTHPGHEPEVDGVTTEATKMTTKTLASYTGRSRNLYMCCLKSLVTSEFLEDGVKIQYVKQYCFCYPPVYEKIFVPKKRLRALTLKKDSLDPRLSIILGTITIFVGIISPLTLTQNHEEMDQIVIALSLVLMGFLIFFYPCMWASMKGPCCKKRHELLIATDDQIGSFYDSKYEFVLNEEPSDGFLKSYLCSSESRAAARLLPSKDSAGIAIDPSVTATSSTTERLATESNV